MTRASLLEVPDSQCLLCDAEALTYADLCDRCAGVVQQCAERVAARITLTVDGPTATAVLHLAGQLELDDKVAR